MSADPIQAAILTLTVDLNCQDGEIIGVKKEQVRTVLKALAEARRQMAERDEALKPFAEYARHFPFADNDDVILLVSLMPKVRAFRRAAALLGTAEPAGAKTEEQFSLEDKRRAWTLVEDAVQGSSQGSGQRGCGEQPEATVDATAALATKRDDVSIGAVIAAGIVMHSHGEDTIAEEILQNIGVTTAAKARSIGCDEYDIGLLKPVFRQIASRNRGRKAPSPASEEGA